MSPSVGETVDVVEGGAEGAVEAGMVEAAEVVERVIEGILSIVRCSVVW